MDVSVNKLSDERHGSRPLEEWQWNLPIWIGDLVLRVGVAGMSVSDAHTLNRGSSAVTRRWFSHLWNGSSVSRCCVRATNESLAIRCRGVTRWKHSLVCAERCFGVLRLRVAGELPDYWCRPKRFRNGHLAAFDIENLICACTWKEERATKSTPAFQHQN